MTEELAIPRSPRSRYVRKLFTNLGVSSLASFRGRKLLAIILFFQESKARLCFRKKITRKKERKRKCVIGFKLLFNTIEDEPHFRV